MAELVPDPSRTPPVGMLKAMLRGAMSLSNITTRDCCPTAATVNSSPLKGEVADPDNCAASNTAVTPSATLSSTIVKLKVTEPLAAFAGTVSRNTFAATGWKSGPPTSVGLKAN